MSQIEKIQQALLAFKFAKEVKPLEPSVLEVGKVYKCIEEVHLVSGYRVGDYVYKGIDARGAYLFVNNGKQVKASFNSYEFTYGSGKWGYVRFKAFAIVADVKAYLLRPKQEAYLDSVLENLAKLSA